jgi:hypothetical protein
MPNAQVFVNQTICSRTYPIRRAVQMLRHSYAFIPRGGLGLMLWFMRNRFVGS